MPQRLASCRSCRCLRRFAKYLPDHESNKSLTQNFKRLLRQWSLIRSEWCTKFHTPNHCRPPLSARIKILSRQSRSQCHPAQIQRPTTEATLTTDWDLANWNLKFIAFSSTRNCSRRGNKWWICSWRLGSWANRINTDKSPLFKSQQQINRQIERGPL